MTKLPGFLFFIFIFLLVGRGGGEGGENDIILSKSSSTWKVVNYDNLPRRSVNYWTSGSEVRWKNAWFPAANRATKNTWRVYSGTSIFYVALINRAGSLYRRILTKVMSTDRTQWGLYTRARSRFSHTDRSSSVNKMFIIRRKQEQFNSFNVTGLY